MAEFGTWSNPMPMIFGGGKSETLKTYEAMRNAVGVGGSAEDETGIDGLWRQCRAIGLAAVSSSSERAALQAIPSHCTDWLDYYEWLLGIYPGVGATEAERRTAVHIAFTEQVLGTLPELEAALLLIDSRLSILPLAYDQATMTLYGRHFEENEVDAIPYSQKGRTHTDWPNYSTEFVITVQFDSSGAPIGAEEWAIITRARAHLSKALPAWVDFLFLTSAGFILDTDLLDVGTL